MRFCRSSSRAAKPTLTPRWTGRSPGAVELREDILGDFAELFAIDGSPDDRHELDFFEVRFNRAFFTFRATRVRSELAHLNSQTPLPEPSDEIDPDRAGTRR